MKKILFFLLLASFFVTGCALQFNQPKNKNIVAGVFKSFDRGYNWKTKNLFLNSGGTGSIVGINVGSLIFDPQDRQAIYLLSVDAGMFYTYDGAASWMKANGLADKKVRSLVIDPENKCVLYAAVDNTIVKSVDCSRSWQEVYIDTRSDKVLTAVAIDSYNNLIVYSGNNSGEIFKSFDGGNNWQRIHKLSNKIAKILIDPYDTRIIYVATNEKGIHKSADGGANWGNINAGLKKYSAAFEFRDLFFNPTKQDSLLLVSKYGLIKTDDGGLTWEPYKLITPPTSVNIYGVAINPKDEREIIYSTQSTFYRTTDGGKNWVTKRLPTAGTASVLEFDPKDPNIVYMGVRSLETK